jgi:hypothetical protein|tara:strand:- start:461 stop:835 length:375 start_codon:yes stop_codon:yes gene_type:complete
MNILYKYLLVLFVGILFGVLAGGVYTMRKIHHVHESHSEMGFMKQASSCLDFELSHQDTVYLILKDFAKHNKLRHDSIRIQGRNEFETLKDELSPHLSTKELKHIRRVLRVRPPKKKQPKNKFN